MTERDWYDDTDYQEAAQQAERATRVGWAVIASATGLLLGLAVIAAVLVCLVVVVGLGYGIAGMA